MKSLSGSLIRADISSAYERFSRYYVPMVLGRGHFEKQATMARGLIARQDPRPERVLDAACGTGHVLGMLSSSLPGLRLAGSDGSPDMVALALAQPELAGIPLSCCEWTELDRLFGQTGCFDFIYFLGNSMAHLPREKDLIEVLRHVYTGLSPGGSMAFDFRLWEHDPGTGLIVEPGRAVGIDRIVGNFDCTGSTIEIRDRCTYAYGRQYITYTATRVDSPADAAVEEIVFSYLPFMQTDALAWLAEAGFTHLAIVDDLPAYPYLVATGKKQA